VDVEGVLGGNGNDLASDAYVVHFVGNAGKSCCNRLVGGVSVGLVLGEDFVTDLYILAFFRGLLGFLLSSKHLQPFSMTLGLLRYLLF
jgi:hypothetical protein